MILRHSFLYHVMLLISLLPSISRAIDIADIKHEGPVDFEKEVLPIFRKSCVACHNATAKEGKFIIETPASILKGGGEGPAVVAGKSAESLLLKLASHKDEPVMPPPDNKVKAKPLTPQELGLIKLWIDQGSQGTVSGGAGPITWQPLPVGLNPIFAVAVSPNGHFAAAGRANQVFLYHVPSKRELGRLTDPALIAQGVYKQPGVAELDVVQSLRFSPDGRYLATGGFRTVKLWRRPEPTKVYDFAGLESAPRAIAVNADGSQIAVGEESGKIKIYAAANGQLTKTITGHTAPVTGLAFSADSSKLLSGSQDKSCRLWNIAETKELGIIETASPVNAVAFVAEEKMVATGGADNQLRTWNLPEPKIEGKEAPKPVKEMAHGGPITSLVPLANGSQLASGSADGQLRLWDVAKGNATKTMNHGAPIEGLAATSDAKRFISVSANNTAKIFNGDNNQPLAEFKGDYLASLRVAEMTRNASLGKRNQQTAKDELTEANKRKTTEEENLKKTKEEVVKTEKEAQTKTEAAKQPVAEKEAADKALAEATTLKTTTEAAKKQADEAAVAAATLQTTKQQEREKANQAANEAANVLKQANDKLAQAKEAAAKDAANTGLADAVKAAEAAHKEAETKNQAAVDAKAAADKAFNDAEAAKKAADENKQKAEKAFNEATAAFNTADQKVKQITPNAMKAVDEKNNAERNHKAAQRSVERADESVKKATEAIGGFENAVKQTEEAAKQIDVQLQASQAAEKESEKPLRSIAISSDGKLVATSGDDGKVHLWDAQTGAAVETFPAQNAPIKQLAFTANGIAAFAANNTGMLWNLSTEWKLERTIGNPLDPQQIVDRVTAIDFTHDSKTIATGSGEPSRSGEIKLWSVENGQFIRALKEPHSDTVFGLEFSPDDSLIASCGADRFMKVFRTADGSFVRSFEGHTHHVTGVSWRADGRLLATCGADSVVKVWDARTGDQQRTIQGLNKEGTSLRFVADGDGVLVSSGANLVRMVNAANGSNMKDFPGNQDYVFSVAASADGKTIAAGGQESVLRVWNDNGQLVIAFDAPKLESPKTEASASAK